MKKVITYRHIFFTIGWLFLSGVFGLLMLRGSIALASTGQAVVDKDLQDGTAEIVQSHSTVTEQYYVYVPIIIRSCLFTYTDDYSNPASGWPVMNDVDYSMGYTNGEYYITASPGWVAWAVQNFGVSDYRIAVDARPTSLEGAVGVIFDVTDYSYYILEVYDGSFAVYRVFNYDWVPLIAWSASGAIHPGTEVNRLGVERIGANISVYANGQLLGSVEDNTYHSALFGIALDAWTDNFEGRFDNFEVHSGQCNPNPAGLGNYDKFSSGAQAGGMKLRP